MTPLLGTVVGWQLDPDGATELTDAMVLPAATTLPFDAAAPIGVAPQLVFLLREDLAGPGVTAAAVCAAASVAAGLAVTAADSGAVTGVRVAAHALPCDFDLSLIGALLELGGDVVATAAGAAIAGHPAEAVARLANDRAAEGVGPLRRGQLVASGPLLEPRPVTAPGEAAATFGRLGTVALTVAQVRRSSGEAGTVAVPADYGVMLDWLTGTIASGHGSRPNDDVRKVTGFPPASFADFAHRTLAEYSGRQSEWRRVPIGVVTTHDGGAEPLLASVRHSGSRGDRAMTVTQLGGLRKLEGRRVSLALAGGHRIDDCELMSAASRCRSVWIFRNGADEFVSTADVLDYWESRP